MYNDFDARQTLINVNEIIDLDFADSQCTSSTRDFLEDSLGFRAIPQEILDDGYLKQDELDLSRWVIDSLLFLYGNTDINSEEYHEAVLQLCRGKWSHLHANNPEDIKRFEIRYRRGWSKADSLYDCWLLLHSNTRECFDYDLFIRRYRDFREALEERYTNSKARDMPFYAKLID